MQSKRSLWILALLSILAGSFSSFIEWGDRDGVWGKGWPIPYRIYGLPDEDQSSAMEFIANLELSASILNIMIAFLVAMVIWSIWSLAAFFMNRV